MAYNIIRDTKSLEIKKVFAKGETIYLYYNFLDPLYDDGTRTVSLRINENNLRVNSSNFLDTTIDLIEITNNAQKITTLITTINTLIPLIPAPWKKLINNTDYVGTQDPGGLNPQTYRVDGTTFTINDISEWGLEMFNTASNGMTGFINQYNVNNDDCFGAYTNIGVDETLLICAYKVLGSVPRRFDFTFTKGGTAWAGSFTEFWVRFKDNGITPLSIPNGTQEEQIEYLNNYLSNLKEIALNNAKKPELRVK